MRSPALVAAQKRYRKSAKGKAAVARSAERAYAELLAFGHAELAWRKDRYRLTGAWPTQAQRDAFTARYHGEIPSP